MYFPRPRCLKHLSEVKSEYLGFTFECTDAAYTARIETWVLQDMSLYLWHFCQ